MLNFSTVFFYEEKISLTYLFRIIVTMSQQQKSETKSHKKMRNENKT